MAGRTDRGVHALGQVASHAGDPAPLRSLNGVLPDDLAVLASEPAPDGFDARRDAASRTYRYRVLVRPSPSPFERGRALWWPRPLDREALAGLRGGAAPGRTTSPRSRPPRPTTSASSATCCAPSGSRRARTCSPS